MRRELTIAELEAERTDLLPARETLSYHGGSTNWATIVASNSSLALNAGSLFAVRQQCGCPDDRRQPGLMRNAWPPVHREATQASISDTAERG